jgi:uncharacterized membrane protein
MIGPVAFRSARGVTRARPRALTGDLRIIGLLIVVHLTLTLVATTGWGMPFLRVPLSIALVLFVPGYCLTAAVFPRRADLTGVQRIGLSIALSIASMALLILLLDALPWRLQPWALILGGYALIGGLAMLALLRRWGLPADESTGSIAWPRASRHGPPVSQDRQGYWAMAILLFVVLVAGGMVVMLPPLDRFTTEFYAIGPDGHIGGYAYQAATDGAVEVTLGVVNLESSMTRYRVEVWAGSESGAAHQLMQTTPTIDLAPGASRELPVEWMMPIQGPARRVDVLLFRTSSPDGDAQPYRELTFWIDVPRSASS